MRGSYRIIGLHMHETKCGMEKIKELNRERMVPRVRWERLMN